MRYVLPLALVLAASGCDCNGSSDAIAEIGTGSTAFMSLTEDQDLELISGPQGGYHFIVNASMLGLNPGDPSMPGLLANPETQFGIFREDGERLDANFPPYRLGYRERIDGSELLQLPSGRILALEDSIDPNTVYDQRIRLTLEIREDGGGSASDDVFIIAREDATPPIDAGVPDALVPDAAP